MAGKEGFEPPRAVKPLAVFKTAPFSQTWVFAHLVVPAGLEPAAYRLWAGCSNQLSYRTTTLHDEQKFHMVAPKGVEPLTFRVWTECSNHLSYSAIMVERKGVEPSTSCVQGRRSSQVSYPPMVKKTGFEPATTWSQTRCSAKLSYFSTFC